MTSSGDGGCETFPIAVSLQRPSFACTPNMGDLFGPRDSHFHDEKVVASIVHSPGASESPSRTEFPSAQRP
ncbi:unnamed protein product [Protopolystoma xenopodis]|uniref:Uncharacterized protein n=1 Tax=Protopolystoma xenopodis TaxID=117903 RepID=A0A448WVQ7_9PLAT|nr:unnamed protein product [Protopolystoma xenopodis]